MPLPTITATGNAVRDPELRFTAGGKAVCSLTLACSSGPKDDPKTKTTFVDVTIWEAAGENVANSITKGTLVTVTGRLEQRSYEAKDGTKRTVFEVTADDVAVNLRFATVAIQRAERGASKPPADDPWATSGVPMNTADEPPF